MDSHNLKSYSNIYFIVFFVLRIHGFVFVCGDLQVHLDTVNCRAPSSKLGLTLGLSLGLGIPAVIAIVGAIWYFTRPKAVATPYDENGKAIEMQGKMYELDPPCATCGAKYTPLNPAENAKLQNQGDHHPQQLV